MHESMDVVEAHWVEGGKELGCDAYHVVYMTTYLLSQLHCVAYVSILSRMHHTRLKESKQYELL